MTDSKAVHSVVLTTTIAASAESCFAVAIDLPSYPDWVEGITSVTVDKKSEGLPSLASFSAQSFGRKSTYVLQYQVAEQPEYLRWSLVEGDLVREIEGSYRFVDKSDEASPLTEVSYSLKIDLAVPLPAFVKRRAEDKILESALACFKSRVESLQ